MSDGGTQAPEVHVADRAAWRSWLAEHAATSGGVWLVHEKGPDRRISAADIAEEALCFGWIDSVPRRRSETQAMVYVAPRRPASSWSRVNKQRVERLRAAGAMTALGEAAVAAAVANGAWTALDQVEDLVEPDDLRTALDAEPAARGHWDGFPRSTKRAILEWVAAAKRPATRAQRVAQVVAEAAVGRRANQWRQPGG